jgi:hypothetical protein
MSDKIQFVSRMSRVEDYQVLDIFLNGFDIVQIIAAVEQRIFSIHRIQSPAGAYEGIPPLLSLPPKKHFWGIADECYQYDTGRVAILENGFSGVPQEWTISVEIVVDGEKVVWQNFRQEQMGLDFKEIAPFTFDLVEYRAVLEKAKEKYL